jgi:thymidylate synthase ThyX
MASNIPLRTDEKQYQTIKELLNKIKEITKRSHVHNLIAALERYLEQLRENV